MTGKNERWIENASLAVQQLAAAGGEDALVALSIVAAQLRARNDDLTQYDRRTVAEEDWIPDSDWWWISGLGIRHLRADAPRRPSQRCIGAYWAAYDAIREMVRREDRPAALRASYRLALAERNRRVEAWRVEA